MVKGNNTSPIIQTNNTYTPRNTSEIILVHETVLFYYFWFGYIFEFDFSKAKQICTQFFSMP